jgi:murein DD-endopeptidase MepM/ murein hydrolase activator NlpD
MRPRGASLRRFSAISVVVALFAALTLPAAAGHQDRLEQIERRKQEVERKRSELSARESNLSTAVKDLDAKRAQAETDVRSLDARLSTLDREIAKVEEELAQTQVELALLHDDLLEVQKRLVGRTNLLTERAVASYKAGPTAYLDGLLSSETFSDLSDRFTYYESAQNADSELVEQIQVLRDATEVQRDLVEEKRAEIAAAHQKLATNRNEVAQLRSEKAELLAARKAAVAQKKELLGGVRQNQARLERVAAQLEQESSQIEAMLAASAAGGTTGGPLPSGGGRFGWPAAGPVTSGFGYRSHPIFGDRRFHSGIDIGAGHGAPVVAAGGGTVVFVGTMSGYGNYIAINHGGGLATTYAHLSAFSVSNGQSVSRGQPVGSVGCTGFCTGPHLHFEVRVNGSPVDPMPYLR